MDTLGNLDRLAVGVGIVVLIARQFIWRTADPRTLLRLPLALLSIGTLTLGQEVFGGAALTAHTSALLAAELALVALLGATMGGLMQLRADDTGWRYRLSPRGIALWALFVAIRVGMFALAARLGAPLLETTGAILLSFGLNRLASALIVRRRLAGRDAPVRHDNETFGSPVGPGTLLDIRG
jgi:hypothetical protein